MTGLFYPPALFLYRRARALGLPLVNSSQVEKDLKALHPGGDGEQLCEEYYAKKISLFLLLCVAGVLLGLLITVKAQSNSLLKEGAVMRGTYEEEPREMELSVLLSTGEEKQFQVTVYPRELSREEAQVLYQEFAARLPELILGKNVSMEQVTEDLELAESFEGYPFIVNWKSSRTDILRSTGAVQRVEEATEVVLTALISYGELEWQETIGVKICPPLLTEEEKLVQEITKMLTVSEGSSRGMEVWELPRDYGGDALIWKEVIRNSGHIFIIGGVLIAILLFGMADKDLHDELMARREAMKRKYPDVVQKLLLYLGAGMTVRAAFQKVASEYEEECRKEKAVKTAYNQFIYREIAYMCRELQTGVSEVTAYENFGRRVGVQEYLRLTTLLSQNLKKGNSTLLQRLKEETERANLERMQNTRKLGEEASTKLLVPMVLLLLDVMLMVMIPAFSAVGM